MNVSPCLGLCRLDAPSRLCRGCARTTAEIAAWRDGPSSLRDRAWAELPERRAKLGLHVHRLRTPPEAVVDLLERTLRPGAGTWVLGTAEANAAFRVLPDQSVQVDVVGPHRIEARTASAAIRFDVPEDVRVLSRAGADEPPAQAPLALAVPLGRRRTAPAHGLELLDDDRDAAARLVVGPVGRLETREPHQPFEDFEDWSYLDTMTIAAVFVPEPGSAGSLES